MNLQQQKMLCWFYFILFKYCSFEFVFGVCSDWKKSAEYLSSLLLPLLTIGVCMYERVRVKIYTFDFFCLIVQCKKKNKWQKYCLFARSSWVAIPDSHVSGRRKKWEAFEFCDNFPLHCDRTKKNEKHFNNVIPKTVAEREIWFFRVNVHWWENFRQKWWQRRKKKLKE